MLSLNLEPVEPRSNFMAGSEQSFLDEVAEAIGKDPIEFRLELLKRAKENPVGKTNDYDAERYTGVLKLVEEKSGWGKNDANLYRGVSAYFCHNSYAAHVLDLTIENGKPVVQKVTCAIDCGIVINLDAAVNMAEGGITDGIGNAFYGEMTFKDGVPQKNNFHQYRMIRMSEAPKEIEVHFVQNEIDPTGLGEPPFPPIFGAVANALYKATGKRKYLSPKISRIIMSCYLTLLGLLLWGCEAENKNPYEIEIFLNEKDQIFLENEIQENFGVFMSNYYELIVDRNLRNPKKILKVKYSYDENSTVGAIQGIYNFILLKSEGVFLSEKKPLETTYKRIKNEDLKIPLNPDSTELKNKELITLVLTSENEFYVDNQPYSSTDLENVLIPFFEKESIAERNLDEIKIVFVKPERWLSFGGYDNYQKKIRLVKTKYLKSKTQKK